MGEGNYSSTCLYNHSCLFEAIVDPWNELFTDMTRACRAELEAQMAAQKDSKRRQKELERQEDIRLLNAGRDVKLNRGGCGAPLRDLEGNVVTNRLGVSNAIHLSGSPQASWMGPSQSVGGYKPPQDYQEYQAWALSTSGIS